MNDVALVASLVAACTLLSWAAGYALAVEDWLGGSRHRFENWAYKDADVVRSDDPQDVLAVDLFWDRAQFWSPRRWLHRGACGFMDVGSGSKRRVPHRRPRSGEVVYGVPTVDGYPLTRVETAATVLRGKVADGWGCPICTGMWGGLVLALAVSHWGPWQYAWQLVAVCQVAGWGLARRVGWGG